MWLIVLFILEFLLFIISYVYFEGNIIEPSIMAVLVSMISSFFALLGNVKWQIEFHLETTLIIISGLLSIVVVNAFVKYFNRHKTEIRAKRNNNSYGVIKVSKCKQWIVASICLVVTILFYLDLRTIGRSMGLTVSGIVSSIRDLEDVNTNFVVRQGLKFVMGAAFVHVYIIVNNCFINGRSLLRNGNYISIIPIACASIAALLTGSRTDIFRLLTAFICIYIILQKKKKKWSQKAVSYKYIVKKLLPIILITVVVMVAVRFFVKGESSTINAAYSPLLYMAYYIGTPVLVLDQKINVGIDTFRGSNWGELSFNRVWQKLNEIGIMKVNLRIGSSNMWIDRDNVILANVDTCFGSPLIDFGVVGMLIFSMFFFGITIIYYYKNICNTAFTNKDNLKLIYFSVIYITVTMSYYTNLWNQVFTLYFLFTFIFIKLIYFLYFNRIRHA